MRLTRAQAFTIFDALLELGHRPVVSGMKVTVDNHSIHQHWTPGTEGYTVAVSLATQRAGVTAGSMAAFTALAEANGAQAWFRTSSQSYDDGEESYGASVTFEAVL